MGEELRECPSRRHTTPVQVRVIWGEANTGSKAYIITAELAMSSLIGNPVKKPIWGENKIGMFSVLIGTTQDIGINGVCSVITQLCHGHCDRASSVYNKF